MVEFKCTRCGEIVTGETELEAEQKFSLHVCKGMRSLSAMSTEALTLLVEGKITEKQAWELTDKKSA